MRRRCSSRHRRHRRIRRALLITLCALSVLSVSSVLLQRLSPSLFRASSHITEANTSEQTAQKTLDLFQQEARREMGRRPIYPYSVISGGVRSGHELKAAVEQDPVDSGIRLTEGLVVLERSCHAVGDFTIVQNCAPTGGSPDDVEPSGPNPLNIVESRRRLVSAERECWLRPGVNAEHGLRRLRGAHLQCRIPRHVLCARARRREEESPASVTSPGVHRVLNCHSYEHHNQAR